MMTLKKAERVHGSMVRLDYEVTHSTDGRDGTTLTADLKMFVADGRTIVNLEVPECDAATPREAVERLSRWLERLKEGIDKRKDTWLPI